MTISEARNSSNAVADPGVRRQLASCFELMMLGWVCGAWHYFSNNESANLNQSDRILFTFCFQISTFAAAVGCLDLESWQRGHLSE